jgi:NADH:ubiquinone oxidoreductase subunit 5 (subunit L)/multisubunit Na+/H+ antiporter MnhA subunit
MHSPTSTYIIIAAVVALILFRRIRRQFGRQRIRRKVMTVRVAILAAVIAFLALTGLQNLRLAEGLLAGTAGGVALGLVGLKLTRFETDTEKGDCYVPNVWIGALLTALLLARLAYRFLVEMPEIEQAATHPGAPPAGVVYHPLTLLVVGLLMGYYLSYYAGLLVHHRRYQASQVSSTQT